MSVEGFDLTAFGLRLREARMEVGYSQRGLAKAAGICQSMVCQAEKGTANMKLSTLAKFVKQLEVSADWLMWGDES